MCIRCGEPKEAPWLRCPRCEFVPAGMDLAKSTYCSVWRFAGDPESETEYESELAKMSSAIRANQPLVFEEDELDRLDELIRFVESGSPGVWSTLFFRMLLPAIVFLGILYFIVALLEKWAASARAGT
jgi:hypothetical protein